MAHKRVFFHFFTKCCWWPSRSYQKIDQIESLGVKCIIFASLVLTVSSSGSQNIYQKGQPHVSLLPERFSSNGTMKACSFVFEGGVSLLMALFASILKPKWHTKVSIFCSRNPLLSFLQWWRHGGLLCLSLSAEDEGKGEREPDKVGAKQGVKQGVQGKVK